MNSVSHSDYLCRSPKSIGADDIVSLGINCGNYCGVKSCDNKENVWIAHEGSLPADSGFSDSIPTGWCVLENHKYKQEFKLLETTALANGENWISIPIQKGQPAQTKKHFKAIAHGNEQIQILNAAEDQLLETEFDLHGQSIYGIGANCPKDSSANQCLFTFGEVEDGPGEVVLILDHSTQLLKSK